MIVVWFWESLTSIKVTRSSSTNFEMMLVTTVAAYFQVLKERPSTVLSSEALEMRMNSAFISRVYHPCSTCWKVIHYAATSD